MQQPRTIAGFDLSSPQQPLDEQGIYWIGEAQEWATGTRGIALYTDERRFDFHLLLFLAPEQVRAVRAFLCTRRSRRPAKDREDSSKEEPR